MAINDFDPQLKDAFSDYLTSIQKSDDRKLNKAFFEKLSFFEQAEKFAKNCFSGQIKLDKIPQPAKTLLRIHNLLLSDLHIGSDIDGSETGQIDFKRAEEARRLAHVIRETVRYKPQYRKNTALAVNLLGDIIENMMHDARTGAVMAEQVCRAISLLRQAFLYLCMHYSKVDVYCATGNHDRRTSRHQKRAVHQKFDSYATIIYYALKESFAHIPHITFHIPKAPIAHYDVFGKKIAYTHADTVLAPVSPYANINVKALEHSVNNMNGALPDKERFSAICYGHYHTGHIVHLKNGTVLIGNGGLPPAGPFDVSLGNFQTNNGQILFESVPGHPVGDVRFIRCDTHTDKDKSLDKIIAPWQTF